MIPAHNVRNFQAISLLVCAQGNAGGNGCQRSRSSCVVRGLSACRRLPVRLDDCGIRLYLGCGRGDSASCECHVRGGEACGAAGNRDGAAGMMRVPRVMTGTAVLTARMTGQMNPVMLRNVIHSIQPVMARMIPYTITLKTIPNMKATFRRILADKIIVSEQHVEICELWHLSAKT